MHFTRHSKLSVARALSCALLLATFTTPRIARAQNFFATGASVDVNGIDQHWTVSANHDGFGPAPFGAAYEYQTNWLSNNSSGFNGGFPNYTYFDFRQMLDLTGYDASTASLTFQWGCDDFPGFQSVTDPYITLNGGAPIDFDSCGPYALGSDVTLTGFTPGVNTLDFYVEGNGLSDGMILGNVEISAETVSSPEPSTFVLVAGGLVVLARTRRRRV